MSNEANSQLQYELIKLFLNNDDGTYIEIRTNIFQWCSNIMTGDYIACQDSKSERLRIEAQNKAVFDMIQKVKSGGINEVTFQLGYDLIENGGVPLDDCFYPIDLLELAKFFRNHGLVSEARKLARMF